MTKAIAVYCGASKGNDPLYLSGATTLGKWLAHNEISLVYGGASLGLMGTLAATVMENNGTVIGVMPEILANREISKPDISEFIIVPDMHARKKTMIDRADAFIAMPGGTGTLEEIFEVITWSQIGLHQKPFAFYNVNGYYDQLGLFLDHMVTSGFTQERLRQDIIITDSLEEIEAHFNGYNSPGVRSY